MGVMVEVLQQDKEKPGHAGLYCLLRRSIQPKG